jgi:DNA-binding transcriptional LysR family regulator
MELRHLRYFVTAAEQVNFSRAARLNVSQPPHNRQIRSVEEVRGLQKTFGASNA